MAIDKYVELTPMENLVVELLVARYRLGEKLWTFDSNVSKQVDSLAAKGYVIPLNGIVPKTVRAMLTDEAVAHYLTFDYVPPIARGNEELTEVFKGITEHARELKEEQERKQFSV